MTVDRLSISRRRREIARRLAASGVKLAATSSATSAPAASGASASSRVATWVGVASAVIGGFLGLNTYSADVGKRVDEKVEKSFEMVAAFNGAGLADARLRVMSYVDAKRYCDARIISRELIDNDFVRVIDFFDLAYACVDAGLCDREAAFRFFEPYANYQQPVLKSVVEEMRGAEQSLRADAGFGEGLAAFATSPSEPPPCDGNF